MSRPLVMDNRYVDSMTVLNAFKSAWECLLESVVLEEAIDCLKEKGGLEYRWTVS